jgi:hypothetical protein
MADLKISQLGSIVTVVPATDVLPVVQGGTTYKVTPNQLLGAGGTATLASATITGALTVGANITSTSGKFATAASGQNVGLQLDSFVSGGAFNNYILNNDSTAGTIAALNFGRNTSLLYGFIRTNNNSQNLQLGTSGTGSVEFFQNNSTAMTLNSTGLGVGVTPSAGKFEALEAGTGSGLGGIFASTATAGGNPGFVFRTASTNRWAINLAGGAGVETLRFYDANAAATRMTLDARGNLLVASGVVRAGGRTQIGSGYVGDISGTGNNRGIFLGSTGLIPSDGSGNLSDNTYDLGSGTYRWDTVFAGTGTINTSDRNEKQDISDPDVVKAFAATAGTECHVAAGAYRHRRYHCSCRRHRRHVCLYSHK